VLKAIAGLIHSLPGTVHFAGVDIGRMRAFDVVRRGVALVPEGRRPDFEL